MIVDRNTRFLSTSILILISSLIAQKTLSYDIPSVNLRGGPLASQHKDFLSQGTLKTIEEKIGALINEDRVHRSLFFGKPKPSGISFDRSVTLNEGISLELTFEGDSCKSEDVYGDNNCHWSWGESMKGSVVVDNSIEYTEAYHLELAVNVFLFDVIPLSESQSSCPVCTEGSENSVCEVDLMDDLGIQVPLLSDMANILADCPYSNSTDATVTDVSMVLPAAAPADLPILVQAIFKVLDGNVEKTRAQFNFNLNP